MRAILAEALLVLAALMVLGVGASSIPLIDPDESRYAAASRSMVERDDLVVPYFNGRERINKPALYYWLQAGAFWLLGPVELAARLPSILAALLTLATVYLFARAERGRAGALRAAAILMTCPLFAVLGKTSNTDMTLCLMETVALLAWYRVYTGKGSRRAHWLAASIAIGLAFLVKGPVGAVVPCTVIVLFLIARGDWRAFRLRGILLGAGVAVAVVLPWATLLVHRLGVSRISELLWRETVERTIGGLDHPEPIHYFLTAAPLVFFPWFAFLVFALPGFVRISLRREPEILFHLIWFLGVIVFFSLIRGKLATYILPAAPPLALLLGRLWEPQPGGRPDIWQVAGAAMSAGAAVTLGALALASQPQWLAEHLPLAIAVASVIALAASVPLLARRPEFLCGTLAGGMVVVLIIAMVGVGPEIGERRSLRALVHEARIAEKPWSQVIAYQTFRPSIVFYADRDVTVIERPRELRTTLDPESVVILETSSYYGLPRSWRDRLRVEASQGHFMVVTPLAPLPPRGRAATGGNPTGGNPTDGGGG